MMLMDGKRIEDLRRIYSLFPRVEALESLKQTLGSYIRRNGQSIVHDDEKDKDMVSNLLEFKASVDTIWEESFSKNEAFGNTIKDAFGHIINLCEVQLITPILIFSFPTISSIIHISVFMIISCILYISTAYIT